MKLHFFIYDFASTTRVCTSASRAKGCSGFEGGYVLAFGTSRGMPDHWLVRSTSNFFGNWNVGVNEPERVSVVPALSLGGLDRRV